MASVPGLLDRLADLTAIRDLERIEFSLLKTLNEFISNHKIGLVRVSADGKNAKEVVYVVNQLSAWQDTPVLSPEMQSAHECLHASPEGAYSNRTDQGVVVVFPLIATKSGNTYVQLWVGEELSLMDRHLVAGVLQIYQNFVLVIQQSQRDQLTGLANRKTFDDCVARVHQLMPSEASVEGIERRECEALNYWLVMIDIDHFKSVNDRFGHLYGDEVLVIMARLMTDSFRESDLIFRFGGEEFVLIIKCADQTSCRGKLEQFRQKVEQQSIPQVGQMTISVGVTLMDSQTFGMTMVDHADQAVYHSKRNGRNQVTFFSDLLDQGLAQVKSIQTDDIAFF